MKKAEPKRLNRETFIVLALYLLFFAWWYVTAYCIDTDPSNYVYIFGFPRWFFLSCIVGYAAISFILWICVKFFFTEIPFGDESDE